jgi:hypothetical protein
VSNATIPPIASAIAVACPAVSFASPSVAKCLHRPSPYADGDDFSEIEFCFRSILGTFMRLSMPWFL